MFSGIELMLGVACSVMGMAAGYLLLMGVFTGIQFISKQRPIKPKDGGSASLLQVDGSEATKSIMPKS